MSRLNSATRFARPYSASSIRSSQGGGSPYMSHLNNVQSPRKRQRDTSMSRANISRQGPLMNVNDTDNNPLDPIYNVVCLSYYLSILADVSAD